MPMRTNQQKREVFARGILIFAIGWAVLLLCLPLVAYANGTNGWLWLYVICAPGAAGLFAMCWLVRRIILRDAGSPTG